jgi:hypothetical protein
VAFEKGLPITNMLVFIANRLNFAVGLGIQPGGIGVVHIHD